MLFWRAKVTKPAAEEPASESSNTAVEPIAEAVTAAVETAAPTEPQPQSEHQPEHQSDDESNTRKIVTLVPSRLTERLAEVTSKITRSTDHAVTARPSSAGPVSQSPSTQRSSTQSPAPKSNTGELRAAEVAATPGYDRALTALRAVMSDTDARSHVLIVGPTGTGRRSAALSIAREIAKSRAVPPDCVYAATARSPSVLQAYFVPPGTGARFVRDANDALAKSSAMLARLMASDSHQMTIAVLEEEYRQRGEGGVEQLRRRAEAQNIALVKTTDGFVLAPMHDGRVVRADVFRALPEGLQRDVEAKVTALEAELQALLGALPGNDIAIDDRHLALSQQTAERAVKPNLAVARKLFANDASQDAGQDSGISELFDAIEADWMRRATDIIRRGGNAAALTFPALQDITAGNDDGAPVVLVRSASARDLFGEIGHDMAGGISVTPGHLARANGGFLIVDAWRLAADPQGWAALSAALETGYLQPITAPGFAVTVEPVPLQFKLILIAERRSLAKLKIIDPRVERYFSTVINLGAAPVPSLSMREAAQ